jgi:hypothetical protein
MSTAPQNNIQPISICKVTLGGYNVYDPPPGGRPTNIFTMHTGGSRYGYGRVLMTITDYNSLQSGLVDGQTQLIMSSNVEGQGGTQNTLQLLVVLAAAVPYSVPASTNPGGIEGPGASPGYTPTSLQTEMVEAVVFDTRVWFNLPTTKSYNCQQQGFPHTGVDTNDFYNSTLNMGSQWTWSDMLTDLEFSNSDPAYASLPTTWKPRNVQYDLVSNGKVYDDIAGKLYLIVGFNYSAGNSTDPNIGVELCVPGDLDEDNQDLMQTAQSAIYRGGMWSRNPLRMPNSIEVGFKVYNQSAVDNPFPTGNRVYTQTFTNNQGSTYGASKLPLMISDYIAVLSGGSVLNTSELDAVAEDINQRALTAWQVPFQEIEYIGIWPFYPDGAIRGIEWMSNQFGATTKIRIGSDKAFNPADELRYVVEAMSGQLVQGMGMANASAGPSGTRTFWQPITSVRVALTMDGGAYGTATAFASLTYTAKSFDGTITYSTLTPVADREIKCTIMTAAMVGTWYRDENGNPALCDVNEILSTQTGCC